MRTAAVLILAVLVSGCTRSFYRRSADRETYGILAERDKNPEWYLPSVSIQPKPESRLFDPTNPDRPPMPPDDPAADEYMRWVDGMRGYKRWHKDGDSPWIEFPFWKQYLTLDD